MHRGKYCLGLRSNSGSKAICLLVLTLFLPFSSAIYIPDLVVNSVELDGASFAIGSLSEISIKDSYEPISFSVSGQSVVETEFIRGETKVAQIAIGGSAGTEADQLILLNHTLNLKQSGDMLILGKAAEVKIEFFDGTIVPGLDVETWPWKLDSSFASPSIDESKFVRLETERIATLSILGSFSISFWEGSLVANNKEFWAGERNELDAQGQGLGRSDSQITHIQIENGSVSSNFLETQSSVYWGLASVSGDNPVQFADAKDRSGKLIGDINTRGTWSFDVTNGDGLEISNIEAEEIVVNGAIIQRQ
jgi:hypothetical protein